MATLTDAQIAAYQRDGYLMVEGFASTEACRELKAAAEAIVDAFDPAAHRSVFTTNEQTRHADQQFLDSANRITCFFEEEALDERGKLLVPKAQSINKIGHAEHDLDPTFERFTYTADLAGVAADLGVADALALQSMYIFKQPSIGGEVGCHQDATFLYTDPITVTGFWFAVEDATLENGCLWAQPGGHRGPLRRLYQRTAGGDGTTFADLDPTPLPAPPAGDRGTSSLSPSPSPSSTDASPPEVIGAAALVPLPVSAGSLVVLHGLLPHWSGPNRSPVSRHAYSVHAISATANYPRWNWLQRDATLPLRRFAA